MWIRTGTDFLSQAVHAVKRNYNWIKKTQMALYVMNDFHMAPCNKSNKGAFLVLTQTYSKFPGMVMHHITHLITH